MVRKEWVKKHMSILMNTLPSPRRDKSNQKPVLNEIDIEEQRITHAVFTVFDFWEEGGRYYGNFLGWAEELPSVIAKHGLLKACVALLDRANGDLRKPTGLLYADLQSWLCGQHPGAVFDDPSLTGETRLLEALRKADRQTLLRAEKEALAYLPHLITWGRKYLCRGHRRTKPLL